MMTRGEAVNWLISIMSDIGKIEHQDLWHYEQALSEIKEMLELQSERKKGKWIDNTFCSKCGWIHEVESGFIGSVKQFNFCPNCGADMKEGKNDGWIELHELLHRQF